MSSLSPLFAAPAVVFLFIAALWYIGRGVPRLLAVLPVAACYAMCAALLLMGGWFHRMAHVTMHGMRLDLTAASGKPREVPIGGALAGDRAEAGLEVPGLPPDSLRLTWENAKLRVLPGPGYERGILVRHFRLPRIEQYLRISIGTPAQCDALVQALGRLVQ